ncbi:MAG: class I SAM-dependent methyltransferase, partial [Candidatus Micrarchaeota archaeon]|nr:class I SAM-dependent methyltransferase [Candidatus Micrarchaeota archaeon]
ETKEKMKPRPNRFQPYLENIKHATANRSFTVSRDWTDAKMYFPSKFIKMLKQLPAGSRVLEVGIGEGRALEDLRKKFPHLNFHGTNYSKPEMETLYAPPRGTTRAEGTGLPFRSNSFHVVFSLFAWPYVVNKARWLEETHRVLKPNGIGFIHAHDMLGNFFVKNRKGTLMSLTDYFKGHSEVNFDKWGDYVEINKKRPKLRIPLRLAPRKSRPSNNQLARPFISIYREAKRKGTK